MHLYLSSTCRGGAIELFENVTRDRALTPKSGLSTDRAPRHSEPGAQTPLFLTHFPYSSFSLKPPPLPLFFVPSAVFPPFERLPSPPPAATHVKPLKFCLCLSPATPRPAAFATTPSDP